jgi:adenylosuccinate lyase
MPRSEAYGIVQSAARKVWAGEGDLLGHLREDPRVTGVVEADALESLFDPTYHLRGIEVAFARLGLT